MATSLIKSEIWREIESYVAEIDAITLKEYFQNEYRFNTYSLRVDQLFLDYSKNLVDDRMMRLLLELAKRSGLKKKIDSMFKGEKINWTEKRAVLHVALRNRENVPIYVDDEDVMPQILEVLDKMQSFSDNVRNGVWRGATGKRIRSVVNIGIGGSDLGPRMVCRALRSYAGECDVYFISNVDGVEITETLAKLDPGETLFLIASKTFTTQETMMNAATARKWIVQALGDEAIANHFVAMTTNIEMAEEFGIDPKNCFAFWDFVGGRYSLWSAIGLSIACYIGFDRFIELLSGAHQMDKHFRDTPFDKNMPVIMGMLGVYYNNFLHASSHAILPYSQSLELFPAFLQQGDMESNGKGIDVDGREVDYQTGPIIWGRQGTDGQHAFYQLIHQGTKMVPADFIGVKKCQYQTEDHHRVLLSHLLAQTEALAFGKTAKKVKEELRAKELDSGEINELLPHKVFKGNRPTNTLILDELSPYTLGQLIALYEHKIFVQGTIWRINSFDQWGVELGKELASTILTEIKKNSAGKHDSSTCGLIKHLLE